MSLPKTSKSPLKTESYLFSANPTSL